MSTSSVGSADGGPNSDTISLTLSGGRTMEMSESFAKSLYGEMSDVSANTDSTNRYSQTDALYEEVSHVIDEADHAGTKFYDNNPDHLDASAEKYLLGLSTWMKGEQSNARSSGEVDAGDAGQLKEFADDFRGAFDAAMEEKYPSTASSGGSSGTGASGGASGDMDMGGVKEALAEVKSSDNSSAKSSALGNAIDALIAQIKGGGEAAPADGRAGELQEDIGKLKDAIGGGSGTSEGGSAAKPVMATTPTGSEVDEAGETDASGSDAGSGGGGNGGGGGEPAPAPAPVTERLEGDALMGRLAGSIEAGMIKLDDAKLNFDDSDGGIGIGDDEIGRGEKMVFTPQSPADGATVELVDLFGGEKGGQENGTIKVMKDGEQVDEIAVRGDMDGNQSVKIDQPFDELVFESNGKESDFAIKSITTETGGAAPDGPGGTDGAPAPDAPGETAPPENRSWSPSVSYPDAADSLTVEVKDASGEWKAIDTKTEGMGETGHGGLADFEAGENPEVRLRNNTTGQLINMDDPQARVTEQEDGTIIVNFEDRDGGDNDFDDAVVTLKPGKPSEAPDAPEGGEGPDAPGGDDGAQAQFDETQLLELLQALSDTIGLIEGSNSLSEADKEMLLDKVTEVVSPMVDALDAGGEGGSAVTDEEVAMILQGVSGLNEGIEGSVDDSSDKNDVLDSLAMGVGQVADAMVA